MTTSRAYEIRRGHSRYLVLLDEDEKTREWTARIAKFPDKGSGVIVNGAPIGECRGGVPPISWTAFEQS